MKGLSAFYLATIVAVAWISVANAATFNYNSSTSDSNAFNNDTINLNPGADVTFSGNVKRSTVNGNAGTGIFNGDIGNNTTFNISGADITVNGDLSNNVTINQSGGDLTVNSVKNNATFNVSGGNFNLNEPIGNNAGINLSGGTIVLNEDDVFANNTNITASGRTIDTQGNSFSVDSLTLSGGSVNLDLGNNPGASIEVGDLSGTGTLQVSNFSSSTQISYGSIDSGFNVGNQVLFGSNPGKVVGGVIVPAPIPEPSTITGGLLICVAAGILEYRRRSGSLHRSSS